jgi:hypothetical protein
LFDLLFEMKKRFVADDDDADDVADGGSGDPVPFVDRLRQRMTERRGRSFRQPNVDWSDYRGYFDDGSDDTPENHPPLLVRHLDDDY